LQKLEQLDNQEIQDAISEFMYFPAQMLEAVVDVPELEAPEPMYHGETDHHHLMDLVLPAVSLLPLTTDSLNEYGSQLVPDKFACGVIDVDKTLSTVNMRGNMPEVEVTSYSVGSGLGAGFSSKVPMQEFSALAERYACKIEHKPYNAESRAYIRNMVDNCFMFTKGVMPGESVYEKCNVAAMLTEELFSKMADDFINDAVAKKYAQRMGGESIFDSDKIRFALKNIFKPVTTLKKFDEFKAGQGISAWATQLLGLYCPATRLIGYIDKLTDRKDFSNQFECVVLNDQYVAEDEFLDRANKIVSEIKKFPVKHGILDGDKFDKGQNENTIYLEAYYMLRLGISEDFILDYYFTRKAYVIVGSFFKGRVKHKKTSGEPGTLLFNTWIVKVVGIWVIYGKGPMIVFAKGDDFDLIQMDLRVDSVRVVEIARYIAINFRYNVSETGEFCGYTICDDGFVPNLYRRVCKISGCRWRDYAHFCEYQKSLRDYIRLINTIGFEIALKGTMMNVKCNAEFAETCYRIIESWAHLDKAQWEEMVTKRVIRPCLPIQGDGPIGVHLLQM
jgi:hypothetical protein